MTFYRFNVGDRVYSLDQKKYGTIRELGHHDRIGEWYQITWDAPAGGGKSKGRNAISGRRLKLEAEVRSPP